MKIDKIIPRKWRIENSLCPYALRVALGSIKNDNDNHYVNNTWIEVLDSDSGKPFENIAPMVCSQDAKEIERLFNGMVRAGTGIESYRELALAVAMLIYKLTQENKIDDIENQGVLISALVIDEEANHQDWGNRSRARDASERMLKYLTHEGYFACKSLLIN